MRTLKFTAMLRIPTQGLAKCLLIGTLCITALFDMARAEGSEQTWHNWNPCTQALAQDNAAEPDPDQQWELVLSPYTYHWNYSAEHRPVILGALERHVAGERFCGLALFRNSFGKAATYVYVGKQWSGIWGQPKLTAKVSAGLIYGYRNEYQDKIPFNNYGVAPAIIPSLSYAFTPHDSGQLMLLGTAGVLFAYSHRF
ncbi:hypothetical protein B9Z39_13745 [Limnohabitans sp. JirII-29]|nr:hypothetical protein B9Z41_14345 [Limnohabitans sp. JirII-31]PUE24067.1 hypothetical protein B9Z39_13745 [Limnohabitans sp. JirII-29]